jgi:enoyl-[acyl-carrier protein] reductase/trans-2-enoyl-CoA reductase (NAD+)
MEVTLEPASEDEVQQTVQVMGGGDWEDWIHLLAREGLLNPRAITLAFSYQGPEITWPIYRDGTIGCAKEHLRQTAERLNQFLEITVGGRALISMNKAVVTQASSAIPVVPLYISILFKVMKARGLHEDCVQQMYKLFAGLFDRGPLLWEGETCVRLDDLELDGAVQEEVRQIWGQIDTANLLQLSDFKGYQADFLKLFGFGCPGVDYEVDVDPGRNFSNLIEG